MTEQDKPRTPRRKTDAAQDQADERGAKAAFVFGFVFILVIVAALVNGNDTVDAQGPITVIASTTVEVRQHPLQLTVLTSNLRLGGVVTTPQ